MTPSHATPRRPPIAPAPSLPGSPLRGGEQDQAKAAEIEAWLEQAAETYNILSMDARTFRSWARLVHRKPDRLVEDAMIAATATVHGLTVVTRNVRDFDRLGVAAFNPFDGKLG